MVTLKQIKISESEASAYYYPEDSTDPGFLVIDLLTEEVKHIDLHFNVKFRPQFD